MTRHVPIWLAAGVAAFALGWCATGASAAAERAADLVKPQLLADVSAVQPGKPFRVGVLLHIAPRWHVYWKNPGDAGQAATVTFDLPPGFKASPLQYPVPSKFLQPGELIAYGYEHQVLLLATITPPADLPASGDVPLRANLKYLVCENICLPGHADLSLTLPASNQSAPANQDLFAEWTRQRPATGRAARQIADVQTKSHPDHRYAIDVTWKHPADNVEFFPGKTRTLNVHDITVNNEDANHTRITFAAPPLANQHPDVPALDSVIAYTDAHGLRRGLEVAVPIKQDQTKQD